MCNNLPVEVEIVDRFAPDVLDTILRGEGIWIAASHPHLRLAEEELMDHGGGVVWGNILYTPQTLLRQVSDPPKATPLIERAVIFDILHRTRLQYFEAVKGEMSVGNEFYRTIKKLRDNLISAAQLEKDLQERGSLKEFDLLTVYKAFESEICGLGMADPEEKKGSRKVKSEYLTPFLKIIVLDGFESIPPGVATIIKNTTSNRPAIRIIMRQAGAPGDGDVWRLPCRVELHASKSIGNESRFIAETIISSIKGGISPDKIGIVVSPDSAMLKELLFNLRDNGLIPDDLLFCYEGLSTSIRREIKSSDNAADLAVRLRDGILKNLKDGIKNGLRLPQISANLRQLEDIFEEISGLTNLKGLKLEPATEKAALLSRLISDPKTFVNRGRLAFNWLWWGEDTYPKLDLIFIPSLSQGSIPPEGKPSTFFQDTSFSPGNAPSYFPELFPHPEAERVREASRLKRYLTNTKDRAVLSYSQISMTGQETHFGNICTRFDFTMIDEGHRIHPIRPDKEAEENIRRRAANEMRDRKRAGDDVHSVIDDIEVSADIKRRFDSHIFSASQLEKYGRCPYEYFLEKIIGLEPIEPPTPEINPKHRGTIIHHILELFYAGEVEVLLSFIRGEIGFHIIEEKMGGYVNAALEKHQDILSGTHPALIDHFKRRAGTICINSVKKEVDLINEMAYPLLPAYTEWEFGNDKTPHLTLADKPIDSPADITGVIDRIDVDAEHNTFSITDYKSGNTQSILGKIRNGEHLQLPIYIEAVRRLLLPDKRCAGAFLFSLRTMEKKHGMARKNARSFYFPGINPRLFVEDDKWDEMIKTALDTASEYINKIRCAEFTEDRSNCDHLCDFRDICRYGKR